MGWSSDLAVTASDPAGKPTGRPLKLAGKGRGQTNRNKKKLMDKILLLVVLQVIVP